MGCLRAVTGELRSCGQPWYPGNTKIRAGSWSKCIKNAKEHGKPVSDPNFPYIFGAGTEVFTPWGNCCHGGMIVRLIEHCHWHFES